MRKNFWMVWLAPAGAWAVYMCWLSGYRSGYEQGHVAAWDSARRALMTVSEDLPHHYQSVAQTKVVVDRR